MGLPESAFVSPDVVEKQITFGDGTVHPVHFKDPGHVVFTRFLQERGSDDEEIRSNCTSKLIAASVCEPDGQPALSFTAACKLKTKVANELVQAIFEIVGVATKKE